jgi:hypothetical protein
MFITQDLSSLGRILGIPAFITRDAVELEKEGLRDILNNKKRKDQDGIQLAQNKLVNQLRRLFDGQVLRRMATSVNWKGEELLPLPPYEHITGIVKLRKKEMKLIKNKLAEAQEGYTISLD